VSAEVELRMLEGSEFQTVGAAMLKPLSQPLRLQTSR